MLWLQFLVHLFSVLIVTNANHVLPDSEEYYEERREVIPRGYYAGVGVPYLPFLEPLTILAGLAFLAFLVQTFHAIYQYHNHGLVGGLLDNVLPTRNRELLTENLHNEEILKAIEFYELINRKKKKKRKEVKRPKIDEKIYIPITTKSSETKI